ncbi:MAG: hypothetical protein AB7L28_18235 [Kofleriaceae bacterium]
MMMDKIFLALHVFGTMMWIGGLFAVMGFLDAAAAETDSGARTRLTKFVRQAAIVPDIGATIAIVFGAHWLFRFKLYQAPYMHIKLTLVVLVIVLHVILRKKVGQLKRTGTVNAAPTVLKPVLSLIVIGILIAVIAKVPNRSVAAAPTPPAPTQPGATQPAPAPTPPAP